jgi:spore maturation protein CgeB
MLSQFTEDLSILFDEDREIVFFRNRDELLVKLKKLLDDGSWRRSVGEAGYAKVYAARHDIESRMSDFLNKSLDIKRINQSCS